MSKAISYYDWELSFKKKIAPVQEQEETVNSLGIPKNVYKKFLTDWEKKNH